MGLFSNISNLWERGVKGGPKVTHSGFLQKDVDKFRKSGDSLASSADGVVTPEKVSKTIRIGIDQKPTFSSTTKDQISTFANIFKKRLNDIQMKRRHPGVMQSRGEL